MQDKKSTASRGRGVKSDAQEREMGTYGWHIPSQEAQKKHTGHRPFCHGQAAPGINPETAPRECAMPSGGR